MIGLSIGCDSSALRTSQALERHKRRDFNAPSHKGRLVAFLTKLKGFNGSGGNAVSAALAAIRSNGVISPNLLSQIAL